MPDRYIEAQLNKARRDVKIVDLFSALMVLAAAIVGFLLVVAVVDHWILPLAGWARWLLLFALVSGTLGYFVLVLLPLLIGRISPIYAARAIEQSEPALKNSVINFLLFREDRAGLRVGIYEALKQRAATDLSHVQVETAVDRTRLIHIGYALIAVLALFASYTILSPKSSLQTARRVVVPWADIARPARVRIEEVEPGSREVFFGERIAIAATCYDLYQDEPVTLVYSSIDGRIIDQTLRMQAGSGGLRYQALLPPGNEGIQQDLIYRIEAGDAVTASYRLSVLPAPMLLVQQLDYEYPAYTGQPNRVVEGQGDVKGVEGTRVTVQAQANQPIRWATLLLHSALPSDDTTGPASEAAPPETVSMTFEGQQARGSFTLQRDATGRGGKHAAYQLRFETVEGHQNVHAPLYRIEVTRDLTPEIEILTPTAERIELPLDRPQRIEVRAIDPDYGLRTISLRAVAGGVELVTASLLDDPVGRTGQVISNYDLKPWEHGLNPGDALVFWAVAEDNRVSPLTGEPEPNVAKTRTYHVSILPPEKPPGGEPERPGDEPQSEPSPAAKKPEDTSADGAGSDSAAGEEPKSPGDSPGDGSQQQPEPGDQGDAAGAAGGTDRGKPKPGPSGQQQSGGQSTSPESGSDSGAMSPDDASGSSAGGGGQSGEDGKPSPSGAGEGDSQGSPAGSSDGSSSASGAGDGTTAGQQPSGGAATATGKRASGDEPLHDGEVFEKTLEYLESQQQDATGEQAGEQAGGQPKPGQTADEQAPPGPAGNASDGTRPEQAGADSGGESAPQGTAPKGSPGQELSDSQAAHQTQTGDQPAGGGQQSQDRNQGAGGEREGAAGEGGQPQGPLETRQEKSASGASSGEPRQGGLGDTGDSGEGQPSEDPSGSAEAQKPNRDQQKQGEGGGQQPQPPQDAQSPSQSKRQRDLPGGASGDQSGEGQKGAGQGAGQEGNDSPGSQSSADDGSGASPESGAGDTARRPGDRQVSEDPTNTPGTQKGLGSSTEPAPGGRGSGGQSAKPSPSETAERPTGRPTPGATDDRGQGLPLGGGRPGEADLHGFDANGQVPPGDEPNLEYARRSTDLVLEYLKDQQQKPDPKLLEELGWNEEDLRQFLQRWEAIRRETGRDEQAQRDMNEALRSLGLRPSQGQTRRETGRSDEVRGLQDTGSHSSPPSRYLEQFNAYKKGTARVHE